MRQTNGASVCMLILLSLMLASRLSEAQLFSRNLSPQLATKTQDDDDDNYQDRDQNQNENDDDERRPTARSFLQRDSRAQKRLALGLRRAEFVTPRKGENNDKLMSQLLLVGLRRVQRRRPELVDLRDDDDENKLDDTSWQAARRLSNERNLLSTSAGLNGTKKGRIEKRAKIENGQNLTPVDEQKEAHKFFYVISPFSEQILPFQSERLAQGFQSLLPLAGADYKTGLRKFSGGGGDNAIAFERASGPSEISAASEPLGCRTIRSSVPVAKDELDQVSGQLVRHCRGRVKLNACEGSCASSIQPSIKSPSGFTKKCACCNEGSFKRVRVRLDECYLPIGGAADQQQQPAQLVAVPASQMEIEMDEPTDCKCRPCDNAL